MYQAAGMSAERTRMTDESPLQALECGGALDEINQVYYSRGWTDGLPIIPPTEGRVRAMLAVVDCDPAEVIAAIPPKWGQATARKLAINAVMAGCLPIYFPVILAAIAAMAEERFNLYSIQATTHVVAPLLIVNGPIVQTLDLNSGHNVFGQGWRANATIGRAIRLALLNIGGATPGVLDRATFGHPGKYSYCIAEHETRSPWEPFHVERGFPRDTSTVTVYGGEAPHNVNDHVSTTAQNLLHTLAHSMATMGMNHSYCQGMCDVFVVFGPEHAETIAREGWTKDDVRHFLYENARIPVGKLKLGGMWGMMAWPKALTTLDDRALLPVVERAADINIIVAGGAGKHSLFIPSFGITRSVTRPIQLAPQWQQALLG
jgi:hypothetical protein